MASLASYGLCQTVCNYAAVSCYAVAGLTFGTVTVGVGMPAAALVCNAALGGCMSICNSKFLAEAAAETAASGGIMGPVLTVGGVALAAGSSVWALKAGAFGASGASAAGAVGVATATNTVATAGTTTAAAAVGVPSAATIVATAGTATVLGPALVGVLVAASAVGIWKWTHTGGNADPLLSSGAGEEQVLAAFPKQLRVQIQISEDITGATSASLPTEAEVAACVDDRGSPPHGRTGPIGKLDTDLRQALVAEYMHHYGEFLGREGHVVRVDNGRVIVSFHDDKLWFGKLREESLPHSVLTPVVDGDAEAERLRNVQAEVGAEEYAKAIQRAIASEPGDENGSVGRLDVATRTGIGQTVSSFAISGLRSMNQFKDACLHRATTITKQLRPPLRARL
mmetsp:Transcript_59012/g.191068  ORF Transcript_59012/g.191068 Transcript_59012/m.191068 type:complete len:397 (+) Transcript_59012:66-1256(+)